MDEPAKKRILVVDDEADVAAFLVQLLETKGFEASAVTDPLKAVSTAEKFRPHLIILDFVMPRLLGPELSVLLKQNAATSKIPVIFLSGMTGEDFRLIASLSGSAAFLEKPIAAEKLIATISKMIPGS